ncbi:MAG: type II toxin-antitoxin system VapC family toxin [Desulfotomaculales bacterium]
MGYLIDTCVLIDHLTGRLSPAVSAWLEAVISSGEAFTSVIVYHELLVGARTAKAQRVVADLLENWEAIPVDKVIAGAAAALRREWAEKGKAMGMADSLIAATASVRGTKVVTSNLRHFPVPTAMSPEAAAGLEK